MIPLPITPVLYARGAGGAPSTSAILPDIRGQLERYGHSIAATGGFEGCTFEIATDLDSALDWLNNLGGAIEVYGPDAEIVWEGFLSDVSISAGSESVDLSLDDLANAVRIRYQPGIGGQVSSPFLTDAVSIATYGRRELIYSGSGMTAAAVTILASTLLTQRKQPQARRSGGASTGDRATDIRLTLSGTGWYYALDWLTTESSSSTATQTTTQLATLIALYNATNAFYATATAGIAASGQSDTEYIEPDTTYRAKIECLMSIGNSAGQRLAYGVYEGRRWAVEPWAGASPATITYQRSLGSGQIFTAGGTRVDPWDVRPNAMYQVAELVDPSLPITADSPSAFYVERVSCEVGANGASVRLEPAKSGELDVLLARLK